MARNRAKAVGSVTPRVSKLFTGRGKTRPIPVIFDESENRAGKAAAADQKPLGEYVNMPSGPRAKSGIFGRKIGGGGKVRAGKYEHGVADNR